MAKIIVQERQVTIISHNENDYISLTDIAKYKSDDPTAVIGNWMRNRNTIEFLGSWESLDSPNFTPSNSRGLEKRLPQGERLIKLNQIAIQQMKVLEGNQGRNLLQ